MKSKDITTVDDFNDYCEDTLSYFCEDLVGDDRYTRDLTDDERDLYSDEYPTLCFMYTKKGAELIERFKDRLYKVGCKYFYDKDLDINTYMFMDLG